MSQIYRSLATRSPSQRDNSYVYAIVPVASGGLAATTSSDELVLLDRQNLSESPILRLPEVPRHVNCLASVDAEGNLILCSGGDGAVAMYDVRSQSRVSCIKTDRAVTALTCKGNYFALGTEFANHQAIVSVWDRRQNKQLWQNAENNDDITALDYHPLKDSVLLAGGDDGQVSIFDTTIAEEDDSLLQGVNHGPIHKAGFLGVDRFFALSSDQNLSIYPVSSPDDNEDPPPKLLGDLRSVIPCEYVIDVFRSGGGYAIAAGSNNSNPRVDIVELCHALDLREEPMLKAGPDYTLEGGHCEEIVRSLFVDESVCLSAPSFSCILTCPRLARYSPEERMVGSRLLRWQIPHDHCQVRKALQSSKKALRQDTNHIELSSAGK